MLSTRVIRANTCAKIYEQFLEFEPARHWNFCLKSANECHIVNRGTLRVEDHVTQSCTKVTVMETVVSVTVAVPLVANTIIYSCCNLQYS